MENKNAAIIKALIEAQKNINSAIKDAKNPHFRSSYATLESVIEAIKQPLLDAKITIVHTQSGESELVTTLYHESGESISTSTKLLLDRPSMQALGSALTYAKRYNLTALLNLPTEDDDGNEAEKSAPKQFQKNDAPKKQVNTGAAIEGHKTEQKNDIKKSNELLDFDNYIIKFGKKMNGKKLADFSEEEHRGMLTWLNDQAGQKGESLRGAAKEYNDIATAWLVHLAKSGPKPIDTNELFPE